MGNSVTMLWEAPTDFEIAAMDRDKAQSQLRAACREIVRLRRLPSESAALESELVRHPLDGVEMRMARRRVALGCGRVG